MCPPEYYGIEYEINPWMNLKRGAINELARRQWSALYHILSYEISVEIEMIAPKKGLPDMVFTANAGLVVGNKVILSNFRYKERRGEAKHFEKWFRRRGFEVIKLPEECFFEGAGDALLCGENIFAGYHFRSDIYSHNMVGEILNRRVLSLELIDKRFYHLDTCLCPLNEDTVLYYPKAFDEFANKVIKNYIPKWIEVNEEEALGFACNAVVHNENIVITKGYPILKRALEDRSYNVFEVEMSEFIKAGGAAKCLTLFL